MKHYPGLAILVALTVALIACGGPTINVTATQTRSAELSELATKTRALEVAQLATLTPPTTTLAWTATKTVPPIPTSTSPPMPTATKPTSPTPRPTPPPIPTATPQPVAIQGCDEGPIRIGYDIKLHGDLEQWNRVATSSNTLRGAWDLFLTKTKGSTKYHDAVDDVGFREATSAFLEISYPHIVVLGDESDSGRFGRLASLGSDAGWKMYDHVVGLDVAVVFSD